MQSARRVLWEINPAEATASRAAPLDILVEQVAARLRQRGYEVETDIGQSDFRCDLAVRVPGERHYRLGILVDTDRFYRITNLMERDVLRPRLLRAFGWNVVLLMTKSWFEDADEVLETLDQRIRASATFSR
jgi:hypothetical protein